MSSITLAHTISFLFGPDLNLFRMTDPNLFISSMFFDYDYTISTYTLSYSYF
ncbi:argininosuccinate synthase, chloroplastic-like isoform X2 [Iris pallida]|uniref:Argininosuccinate synthase, chloroplastic-like isoform X2 n=1 Tax=Iris pallida TaxID=29817 RepID=A0AAX6E814_IRIPA|nr:argininosuccinate synthase, chloroplastic-like isoform X2 [Iris pallida]